MMKYCLSLLAFATVGIGAANAATYSSGTLSPFTMFRAGSSDGATYTIDKRKYVSRDQAPYSAVITLKKNGRTSCTGTLTADGIIVTARHCIVDETGKVNLPDEINHATYGGLGIAQTKYPDKHNGHDWALMVPKTNVHSDIHVSEFGSGFKSLVAGSKAQVVGYGALKILSDQEITALRQGYAKFINSDRKTENFNASSSTGKKFVEQAAAGKVPGVASDTFSDTGRLKMSECEVSPFGNMNHGCQAWFGNSGGPVFVEGKAGWYLFGILSSGKSRITATSQAYAGGLGFVPIDIVIDSYKALVGTINQRM